jgi:hypothetical protein
VRIDHEFDGAMRVHAAGVKYVSYLGWKVSIVDHEGGFMKKTGGAWTMN